jgi:hypothetical protein
MIKIAYKENIIQLYYDDLSKRKYKDEEYKTLKEIFDKKFKTEFDCTLDDLLFGSFEKLQEIKNNLGDMSKRDDVKTLFNYETKFQQHISKFFEQYVEVHTCYFCNIEFINTFMTKDENIKNGFTLDHYIDKGKYPYLALSLYNLIPSCYTCNSKVKRVHEVETLSPASAHFDFDAKVKFKTFMQNENLQIDNQDDFELLLKEDFTDSYNKYIEVFELDGRYEYHKYKVIEMINKRKQYPDSRIKELAELTQKIEEEVKQDLFGEYLFEDDNLHKRPLSKLTRDISKELGLV